MNLYEFSQINNNEMGVLIERASDAELYRDAYEEAQRIIRISEEVRISLERVSGDNEKEDESSDEEKTTKLTSSKLGQRRKLKTVELLERMVGLGYLEGENGKYRLTKKGQDVGGELRVSPKFGTYFLWPEDISI